MIFLFMAFFDQLLIPGFKDVQVQVLPRVYNNLQREYGDEICHSN